MKRKVEEYLKESYGSDASVADPVDGHFNYTSDDIVKILVAIRDKVSKKVLNMEKKKMQKLLNASNDSSVKKRCEATAYFKYKTIHINHGNSHI